MQELIKVSEVKIGQNFVHSVSARELHEKLGVKKDFTDWAKAQIKRGMFDENIDYMVVWSNPQKGVAFLSEAELLEKFENTHRARASGYQSDYILTIDVAKHIAMMSGTAKGKEVRNYFIELEKRYFQKQNQTQKSEFLVKVEERTQLIEEAGKQFKVFKEVFQDIGITEQKELAITTNRAVKNETTIDFIAISGKNGLEAEEKFFTVTELCEFIRESDDFSDESKLSVSTKNNQKPQPINLNKILESHGFQFKIDKQWKPTKTGEKFVKFVQNKSLSSTKNIFHLNWKLEVLREVFKN